MCYFRGGKGTGLAFAKQPIAGTGYKVINVVANKLWKNKKNNGQVPQAAQFM